MVAIAITILALNFLAIPFTFVAEGEIDAFDNDGWVRLSLFGVIKLLQTQAYLKQLDALHNDLIIKGKKKEYEFHINANKRDEKSIVKLFDVEFVPYVNLVSVDLGITMGKRDDAFFTTLALGGIRIALCGVFGALKSSQKLEVSEEFIAEYNKDIFRVVFIGIINVSIADIIYSFLLYLKKKLKKSK